MQAQNPTSSATQQAQDPTVQQAAAIDTSASDAEQQKQSGRVQGAMVGLAGGAMFAIILGLGVLVGILVTGNNDSNNAEPKIVTVGPGATTGGPATTAPTGVFTSDWPVGKNGFTVQLQTLPKEGTQPAQVQQAKTDAQSKGAPEVGALLSDDFASLPPGNYIIYSGQFDDKKQADAALKGLTASFPGASVVEVSSKAASGDAGSSKDSASSKSDADAAAIKKLEQLSPEQFQEQNKKVPDEVETPGTAPPTDNKDPGGGSGGGTTIG